MLGHGTRRRCAGHDGIQIFRWLPFKLRRENPRTCGRGHLWRSVARCSTSKMPPSAYSTLLSRHAVTEHLWTLEPSEISQQLSRLWDLHSNLTLSISIWQKASKVSKSQCIQTRKRHLSNRRPRYQPLRYRQNLSSIVLLNTQSQHALQLHDPRSKHQNSIRYRTT